MAIRNAPVLKLPAEATQNEEGDKAVVGGITWELSSISPSVGMRVPKEYGIFLSLPKTIVPARLLAAYSSCRSL
jgi:hypothetical protein